jgi:hypothetical protein
MAPRFATSKSRVPCHVRFTQVLNAISKTTPAVWMLNADGTLVTSLPLTTLSNGVEMGCMCPCRCSVAIKEYKEEMLLDSYLDQGVEVVESHMCLCVLHLHRCVIDRTLVHILIIQTARSEIYLGLGPSVLVAGRFRFRKRLVMLRGRIEGCVHVMAVSKFLISMRYWQLEFGRL